MSQQQSTSSVATIPEGAGFWYRVQPNGLDLFGQTSTTSNDELLDDGYVFAFASPDDVAFSVRHEWCSDAAEIAASELVVFTGSDDYDPGDAEGYAVLPAALITRLPLADALSALEGGG